MRTIMTKTTTTMIVLMQMLMITNYLLSPAIIIRILIPSRNTALYLDFGHIN